MAAPILEVTDLTKHFPLRRSFRELLISRSGRSNAVCALGKVNISVCAGEIFGVVGPNGAGKTTLLRVIADLLAPDHGRVRICGNTVGQNSSSLRRMIGYVSSDERTFFWRLTGRQNLEFFACLYGLPRQTAQRRVSALLTKLGLTEKANQLFRDYSAGTRKKFALVRALVHQPHLLLLDELTNSLDPGSVEKIKTIVREYVSRRKHAAAVWSTHRLEEIAEVCDRFAVLKSGRVTHEESVASNSSPKQGSREDFVLCLEDLTGRMREFADYCLSELDCRLSRQDTQYQFVFPSIDSDDFGQLVSVAVTAYGAHILFAGPQKKSDRDIGDMIGRTLGG